MDLTNKPSVIHNWVDDDSFFKQIKSFDKKQKKAKEIYESILSEREQFCLDTLDRILVIDDNVLAVDSHALDMKIGDKSIYDHLQIYKNIILDKYHDNISFIQSLPEMIKKIKKIWLYMPINTNGHSILWDEDNGVPDVALVKGVFCRRYTPEVRQYIQELESLLGDRNDAVRCFVLILGLGKYGRIMDDGKWDAIWESGSFFYSIPNDDEIECIYYNDKNAQIGYSSSNSFRPVIKFNDE